MGLMAEHAWSALVITADLGCNLKQFTNKVTKIEATGELNLNDSPVKFTITKIVWLLNIKSSYTFSEF